MATKTREVIEAYNFYSRRDTLSTAERKQAALRLAEHGLWSKRHIAMISGLDISTVAGLVQKSDRTGGRFSPGSLDLLVELCEKTDKHENDAELERKIIDEGTGYGMLEKITGLPHQHIRKRVKALEALEAARRVTR